MQKSVIFQQDTKILGIFLIIDLIKNKFLTTLMVPKLPEQRNEPIGGGEVDLPCSARVDTQTLYSGICNLNLDGTTFFIDFTDVLDTNFLSECLDGRTLRVKLQLDSGPLYYNYSLSGYTSAMNRLINLHKRNKGRSIDSTRSADAKYFDI